MTGPEHEAWLAAIADGHRTVNDQRRRMSAANTTAHNARLHVRNAEGALRAAEHEARLACRAAIAAQDAVLRLVNDFHRAAYPGAVA